MNKEIKSEIYRLVDTIEDENILQMIMEDVVNYAGKEDLVEELTKEQINEMDEAISKIENNETMDWKDFKKEINEWKDR